MKNLENLRKRDCPRSMKIYCGEDSGLQDRPRDTNRRFIYKRFIRLDYSILIQKFFQNMIILIIIQLKLLISQSKFMLTYNFFFI